jgi:hypothetical protein
MDADRVLREKVETLDGSRQLGAKGKAAVRLDDFAELMRLPERLQSVAVSGSVTVAAFNNLVEDVTLLHKSLLAAVDAMRERRGR